VSQDSLKRSLARLDIPALVDRAQKSLENGDADDAVLMLRTAVRRAPFRRDLRRALMDAIEAESAPDGRRDPNGPVALPKFKGDRLVIDDEDEGDDEIRIEEVSQEEMEAERRAEAAKPRRPRANAAAARRTSAADLQRRPRRAPLSALLVSGAVVFILVGAGAGGAAWHYFAGKPNPFGASAGGSRAVDPSRLDEVLIENARRLEGEGRFAEAEEKLLALSDGPRKDELLGAFHFARGDEYTRNKQYAGARDAYEAALARDPKNARYAYNLGSTNYTLGRDEQARERLGFDEKYDKARRNLKLALDIEPTHLDALMRLADVEFAQGRDTAGADCLNRIIQIEPKSDRARVARSILRTKGFIVPDDPFGR
jgi:tetratricopeptide (TPR) repeat protein